jgi:diguanylate cyclase
VENLFISVVWILPSVLVGVLIGHYWGRAPVLIRERKLAQQERQVTLKALLTLMESTQQLTTDVDSHTSEIAAVQRSVGGLEVPEEFQQVQTTLVQKVTEVIEANQRLEDDLVVARYRMQEQAQELDRTRTEARTDVLSGVDNRKAFEETLDFLIRHFKRQGTSFAVIMCDVDHFKWINDTHGHPAGDRVVNHLGAFLKSCLRAGDYVSRYGGDEFALLLPGAPLKAAEEIADRIRLEIECRNFDVGGGGQRVAVTLSVGVAAVREGDTQETVLERVDRALYKSKESGRNQTHVYIDDDQLVKAGV